MMSGNQNNKTKDINMYVLGVQKSSELFFVKFNLYLKTNEKIWLAA